MNLGVHERQSTREDEKKADKAGKDTAAMVEATVVTSATTHTRRQNERIFFWDFSASKQEKEPRRN